MPITTFSNRGLSPFWPAISSGRLYSNSLGTGGLGTLAVTSGLMYACPIFISNSVTLTAIGIEVTAFATGSVQLGLYVDSAGVPSALKFDAGNVSTGTSNSFKSISISQLIADAGWYWIAGIFSATPTVRAVTTANSLHMLGFSSGTDTVIHSGITVTQAYGALPNPFTGGSALATVNFPRLMVQA